MESTLRIPGDYLENTLRIPGEYLEITWRIPRWGGFLALFLLLKASMGRVSSTLFTFEGLDGEDFKYSFHF